MFKKKKRLKKRKDFERVLKKGKQLRENCLVLRFLSNDLKERRFAFIVSQRVSKKAVARNKLKRRLSEIVREKEERFPQGNDYVFIALKGLEGKSFFELNTIIENLISKIEEK